VAVSSGAVEQTLLDVQSYFNANFATYLTAIDKRLGDDAPTFGIGARNLTTGKSFPQAAIVQDPGTAERSGNAYAELTLGYNIGISVSHSKADQLEKNMARYIDAALDMVLENPTLGGICFEANLTNWETVPPDPDGPTIGLVLLTLELSLEVSTAA